MPDNCHVIISTRSRSFFKEINGYHKYSLGTFTRDEALSFLRCDHIDSSSAMRLSEYLSYMPSSLATARMYLDDNIMMGVDRYIELLETKGKEIEKSVSLQDYVIDRKSRGQISSLLVLIESMDRESRDLLNICSVLYRDNIPRGLIEDVMKSVISYDIDYVSICNIVNGKINEASLIHPEEEGYVGLHNVTQVAVRSLVSRDDLGRYIEEILKYLNDKFVKESIGDSNRVLVSHIESVLKHVDLDRVRRTDLYHVLCKVGRYYWLLGRFGESMEKYEGALSFAKKHPNLISPADLAMSYNGIAGVYWGMGKYGESLENLLKALGIRKAAYKDQPNHPDLGASYNNIGLVYGEMGKYGESLENLLKDLEILKAAYKDQPNHPDLGYSYNGIGVVYYRMGKYEESLENHFKALGIWKAAYKDQPNHPHLGYSYNNIGEVYRNMGKYEESLENLLKGLEIKKAAYKDQPNHPLLGYSYHGIGNALAGKGEYAEGIKNMLEAIRIRSIAYNKSPNHPDLIECYYDLGGIYSRMYEKSGSKSDAKSCISEYLEALKRLGNRDDKLPRFEKKKREMCEKIGLLGGKLGEVEVPAVCSAA